MEAGIWIVGLGEGFCRISYGGNSGEKSLVSARWKVQMEKTGNGRARSRMKRSRIKDERLEQSQDSRIRQEDLGERLNGWRKVWVVYYSRGEKRARTRSSVSGWKVALRGKWIGRGGESRE